MTEILYANSVVLGDGVATPLRVCGAELRIEGGRIAEVRELSRAQWAPSGGDVKDLGDALVCPAFVNAHTHVALNAFRGLTRLSNLRGNMVENLFYRLEAELSDADVRAFARMGAHECLANGVGLVWDHYYGGCELAAALVDVGLPAVVAPTLQDVSGPGVAALESQLNATEALDDPSWRAQGIWPALGPHATDTVSPELWSRIGELARSRGWVIHAHVAQSVEELERSVERHQCTPVELLERNGALDARFLLVHGLYLNDSDVGRLDRSRHALGFCPLSQAQFGFPAYVASWTEADIPWIVATDCAPTNDAMNVQRELPFVAATRAFATTHSAEYEAFRLGGGIEAARALEARRVAELDARRTLSETDFLLSRVWSVPGSLHPAFRAGVIEPGALANLLVIDPEHPSMWPHLDPLRSLALADTRDAIRDIMLLGEWCPTREQREAAWREHAQEARGRLRHHLRKITEEQ